MWNSNLNGAYLDSADLNRAGLRGISLKEADLKYTDLKDTDFTYADLRGTIVSYSPKKQILRISHIVKSNYRTAAEGSMSLLRSAAGGESCLQDSFLPYRKFLRQKEIKIFETCHTLSG